MKNILIVDDNTVTLSMLSKVLTAHCNIFEIFTAQDGKAAIPFIDDNEIDLVITDLSMPRMNGFALIEYILKSHPDTPIIVISAYGTPEIEAKFNSMPTITFFNKPLKTDIIINTALEKLEISYGQIDGIGLSSFLQLLELESKTCTLSVTSNQGNQNGTLYFLEGALIAAETTDLKDETAAYEIISWEDAKIQIINSISKEDRKITQPLMNILMEAAKLRDEKESEKSLNISGETADKESKQESTAQEAEGVFDEITLPETKTEEEGLQQFDEPPEEQTTDEQITAEQLLDSDPMAETLLKMKEALGKIMGPIAELVFTDSLNSWIETGQPSQSSLPSLLIILDNEINDPDKITKYHEMVDSFIY